MIGLVDFDDQLRISGIPSPKSEPLAIARSLGFPTSARPRVRLRVMAVLTAGASVSKLLDHLRMRSVPPPVARARAPDVAEQVELE